MAMSKCVLVVDDDEMVATVITLMLKELGYQSIVKDSAQGALDAFQESSTAFDVVITDLTMPDIHGIELARRLKQTRKTLPVLMMSGHAGAMADTADTPHVDRFLLKPLRLEELRHALEDVLGS